MELGDTRESRKTPQKKRVKRRKHECFPPSQQYPWLLYVNEEFGKKNQMFCSISDPTVTYTRYILELRDPKLWTIQHGWCLLANLIAKTYKIFLWNPYSLKKIELPPFIWHVDIGDCIVSSSPTATDQVCDIFLFSSHTTSIFYCQLGDDHWNEVDYRKDLKTASYRKVNNVSLSGYESYLDNPVYCNGCLYAELFGRFLVVVEKHGHRDLKINSKCILMPILPPTSFLRICRLLGSNNELFQIEILHTKDKVISVNVYKFEFALSVWEKVKSIKDRVFFVSCIDSPFACQAINSETEGGRIYFTLTNKKFVYIYNIEDKNLMFSQPLPNMRSSAMWFVPKERMTADILKEKRGKPTTREKESICGAIHLNEKEDTTTNDYELPFDVVEVIAKRLNLVFDYLHFRATVRIFRLVAPPIQWNVKSVLRFDNHSLCPLLVFLDKDNVFNFVHPKHGLKYKYTIKLPKVHFEGSTYVEKYFNFLGGNICVDKYLNSDCEICYSKDGWLLLTMKTNFSFFFNPFTKEMIPFKYGPITIRSAKCVGFSHCPTSYKCVIAGFEKSEPFQEKTLNFTIIDSDTRYDSSFDSDYFSVYNRSPTFHNGSFYFLSNKGMLGVIKLTEEEGVIGTSWKEFSEPESSCTDSINTYLVECNGNQLSVFEWSFGESVRIFKLNESKMTWTKVESLGNHMLFVGNTSYSAVAKIPGMENKIYFPRFYGQSIVFYSLETKKYHTFQDEVVNFENVREPLNSSWIEPRWK